MANRDLELALRLSADSSRLLGGLARGEGGLRQFGSAARREMDALGRFAGSVEGRLAQLGLGVSAAAAGMQSAKLDKDLKQLQLTAGATAKQADVLRQSWLEAQIATGQGVDELKAGSNALIAAGLSIKEANAAVLPMAETMAVAKTDATLLGQAMGVAAQNFNIDLRDPKEAALLLDKMVVAGRLGNAELENLPDIFAKIGVSAGRSNLNIDQTLSLVETLSAFEPNADRLGTLVNSTLRIFTTKNYMESAAKATGVKFFDTKGARRDAFAVLQDLRGKYAKLTTDAQRFGFISKAWGSADEDTIKGASAMLGGRTMENFTDKLQGVKEAGGTIKRNLSDALDNAVDQTGRLQGALRKAADDFARPINQALSDVVKFGLDGKDKGGLGLDGNDLLLGGAVGAAGLFGAARLSGKAIQGIAGKLGSTAAGVVAGRALEEATGVTPVFVVNMPRELGGTLGTAERLAGAAGTSSLGGKSHWLGKLGVPLLLATTGLEAYSLATDDTLTPNEKMVGYSGITGGAAGGLAGAATGAALGSAVPLVGTAIGGLVGGALGYWGGGSLGEIIAQAVAGTQPAKPEPAEVTGKIEVHVTSDGVPRVTQLQSSGGVDMSAYTGKTGAGS